MFEDIVGKQFGRLTVLRRDMEHKRNVICQCNCANKTIKSICKYSLTQAKNPTQSCGCLARELSSVRTKYIRHKHGLTRSVIYENRSIYNVWRNMKYRCYKPDDPRFADYGGRGIKVCERYLSSACELLKDLGPKPSKQHSLDRIDNNKNYSCGICDNCIKNCWKPNCRWSTPKQQSRNLRNNVTITYHGHKKCLSEWAEVLNVKRSTLQHRLLSGWNIEEAFEKPVCRRRPADVF